MRLPQIMSWTIAVQREVARDLSLDVAYIGSHSTHLAQAATSTTWTRSTCPSAICCCKPPGPPAPRPPMCGAVPGFTDLFQEHRGAGADAVPAVHLGGHGQNDPVGSARFNSLQVKVTKRYSNGLTLLAFWTWMKNMGTLRSVQYTPYRPITYSGDSPPHTLVINASYDLPFGPKRKFLSSTQSRRGRGRRRLEPGGVLPLYRRSPWASRRNNLSTLGYGAKIRQLRARRADLRR